MMEYETQPCPFRGCEGTMERFRTIVQRGTGDRMFLYECRRKFRHRGWLIESLGVLNKESAGRWDTSELS